MVIKLITETRNEKLSGPSRLELEMVLSAGKAGVDMVTDMINQMLVEPE